MREDGFTTTVADAGRYEAERSGTTLHDDEPSPSDLADQGIGSSRHDRWAGLGWSPSSHFRLALATIGMRYPNVRPVREVTDGDGSRYGVALIPDAEPADVAEHVGGGYETRPADPGTWVKVDTADADPWAKPAAASPEPF